MGKTDHCPVWRRLPPLQPAAAWILNWAFPQGWCKSRSRSSRCRWRVGQDAGTEEFETGMPVHLALDRLESVDLSFDLTGAPRGVYSRPYGGDIFL
jgi:hypothetical protein